MKDLVGRWVPTKCDLWKANVAACEDKRSYEEFRGDGSGTWQVGNLVGTWQTPASGPVGTVLPEVVKDGHILTYGPGSDRAGRRYKRQILHDRT